MPSPKSPAQVVADGVSYTPQMFYVRKSTIAAMLLAIRGEKPSPMNPGGTKGLADRTDVSGKFARRVGQNRRALEKANEQITEEQLEVIKRFATRYPELAPDGSPHPQAGEIKPVYATKQDGSPIFKPDRMGNDTEERVIAPESFDVVDQKGLQLELKQLFKEFIVVEAPGFTEDDWNAFGKNPGQDSPIAKIIDPLIDLERDGPTTEAPSGVTDIRSIRRVDDVETQEEPEPSAP